MRTIIFRLACAVLGGFLLADLFVALPLCASGVITDRDWDFIISYGALGAFAGWAIAWTHTSPTFPENQERKNQMRTRRKLATFFTSILIELAFMICGAIIFGGIAAGLTIYEAGAISGHDQKFVYIILPVVGAIFGLLVCLFREVLRDL